MIPSRQQRLVDVRRSAGQAALGRAWRARHSELALVELYLAQIGPAEGRRSRASQRGPSDAGGRKPRSEPFAPSGRVRYYLAPLGLARFGRS
ncbi:MAG: hypothetical protein ACLQBB_02370 [Solirubrobacteraceae bacterium]